MAFVVAAGTYSGLMTTNGTKIFLYVYPGDNNVVLAREGTAGGIADPSGRLAFAIYLDTGTVAPGDAGATGAKVWLAQYDSLLQPDATNPNDLVFLSNVLNYQVNTLQSFSLEKAPSGQNLFLMFGHAKDPATAGDDVALVVTAADAQAGGTVNSSQGGTDATIGTNNQMIDANHGLIFTFVTNANPDFTVPNLTHAEATTAADIQFEGLAAATMASFVVSQTQPNQQTTTVKVSAFNTALETGTAYVPGLHNDSHIDVTSVTVRDPSGTILEKSDGSVNTANLSISIVNGIATITGAKADYTIEYTTTASHNRVEIDNVGSGATDNAKFDIGNFKLQTGSDNVQPLADLGFADDAPTAAASLGAGAVAHDETVGNQADANDTTAAAVVSLFSGVTTTSSQMAAGYAQGSASVIDSSASVGGADGLASTVYSLAVSAAGVDSGLDTVAGDSIFLFKEGDLVVGRITSAGADNGKAAFAVAINSSTGVLSMAQYNAIKHPTGGTSSPDESLSVANTALLAVVTVTDGDGDPSSASVAIGARVSIQDDGPSAAAALGTGQVRHDETVGNQGDADDSTAAGVISLFSGVTTTGTQMAAGYAQGSASVIDSSGSSGGVDGLASTAYSLDVSAAGVDSGLDTVAGDSILLYKEGSLVIGRISSAGADNGKAAFAIAINSSTGVLSMAQYNAIKHPTGGTSSPDESLSINNAALLAVATVTDGDGDTSAASVAIGARVSIQDDGPSAAAALGAGQVRHDETVGNQADADDTTAAGVISLFSGVTTTSTQMAAGYAQGSASVIDSSGSSGGVDGIASTVYSLDVSAAGVDSGLDTVAGDSILLYKEGSLVIGRISSAGADNGKAAFAIAINSSTGVLSMAQYNAIKHPTGGAASPDESLSVANAALLAIATVTDGDGDASTASVAVGARVSIQDDGPSAAAALGTGQVRHDETVGNQADADDTTAAGVISLFSGVTTTSTQMAAGYAQGTASVIDSSGSSGGVDGIAGTVYSLAVSAAGVDSGLDTVAGDSIFLFKEGNLVIGRISSAGADNGKAAFAVAINSSTGVLSMAQYNAIKHPTGGASSPDESLSVANAALLAVATVTDGDGDTSAASVAIGARVSIQDDGPSAAA
ncbi:DUF5801 repeats-in-toxin domain-containing protein, partial [Pseudoduganella sp. RAF53_2]|uniref:DUF5801 repeats-in-toxin domain-containing protein n=1 Tax=Pseudoduganella sp. RAF53_2 TaxID=3233060 RepID=UPI003F99AE73